MSRRKPRLSAPPRSGRALRHPATAGLLTALLLAGCGGEVPQGSIAVVGDTPIERSVFDRSLTGSARVQQQSVGIPPEAVAVPDPPRFDRCAVTLRSRPRNRGERRPTVEQAHRACRALHDSLRQEVTSFLLKAQWLEQEAEERGVGVSEEEVARDFGNRKRRSFPDDRAYRTFLLRSGQREEDLVYRARLELLRDAVRREVIDGEEDRRAALGRFTLDFERSHREETVCAPGYMVDECGNRPPGGPAERARRGTPGLSPEPEGAPGDSQSPGPK